MMRVMLAVGKFDLWGVPALWLERKLSTKALGSDIEYPLRSNALSAKSVLGGRVALTVGMEDGWDGRLSPRTTDQHQKKMGLVSSWATAVELGDCLCKLDPFLSTTPPGYHHRAPARELTS